VSWYVTTNIEGIRRNSRNTWRIQCRNNCEVYMKIGKVHLLSPTIVLEHDAGTRERVLFPLWCHSSSLRTVHVIFQHIPLHIPRRFQHFQHHVPTFSHASRRKRIISNAWPWALLQRPRCTGHVAKSRQQIVTVVSQSCHIHIWAMYIYRYSKD
jgi:hypothetical protein